MGGLFHAPKPVIVQAAPLPAAVVAATPAAPPDQQGQDAQAAAQARAADGMQGLVATSDRGVLAPLPDVPARKSLLGE